LKVLHLNTYTFSRILSFPHYQFHHGLIKSGHESVIVSATGDVHEDNMVILRREVPFFSLSRVIRSVYFQDIIHNDTSYFYPEWNLDLISLPEITGRVRFKPDVILTYWTKFAFNQRLIFELSRYYKAPVITIMADLAPLTGGCHYPFECTNYFRSCGKCPLLKSTSENDLSRRSWLFKKNYIDRTDLTLVAGSSQDLQLANKSPLYAKKNITKLLASIDEHTFTSGDKIAARKRLQLPLDKKIIFFGAARLTESRKGLSYLVEALNILDCTLGDSRAREQIILVTAGEQLPTVRIPFQHIYLGYLKTEPELANAYQCADVFACPTVQDSGPVMVNQAIMCGTPVVSFDVGVALDLVHTAETGYRAMLKDSHDLAQGLQTILSLENDAWEKMSGRCRNIGLSCSSRTSQASRLHEIIKSSINNVEGRTSS